MYWNRVSWTYDLAPQKITEQKKEIKQITAKDKQYSSLLSGPIMALCSAQTTASCSSSSSTLFPLSSFRSLNPLNPILFSNSLTPKPQFLLRNRSGYRKLSVTATATVDSGNGAVVMVSEKQEKSESSSSNPYGRQYFPLAAVVGQVPLVSLSLKI